MLSQKLKAVLGLALVVALVAGCGAGVKNTNPQGESDETRQVEKQMSDDTVIDASIFPKMKSYPEVTELDIGRTISGKWLKIYPTADGDVCIRDAGVTVDAYGNEIEGALNKEELYMKFFRQTREKGSDEFYAFGEASDSAQMAIDNVNSNNYGGYSKAFKLNDGSRIRWIGSQLKERYKGELKDQEVIDGIQTEPEPTGNRYKQYDTSHSLSYVTPPVLSKTDYSGKVLWQKIYIKYDPWWKVINDPGEGTSYTFQYFKFGKLAVIDENRLFVSFNGTTKIYRLNQDGNVLSKDSGIIVLNYSDYERTAKPDIEQLYDYKTKIIKELNKEQDRGKREVLFKKIVDPCYIGNVADYDYIGEKLIAQLGLDVDQKSIDQLLSMHSDVMECIERYRQMEKEKN